MAQYTTTSTTPDGLVVNIVLDTEANTNTYTVTAPNGATATNTQDASLNGSTSANLNALRDQLVAGGASMPDGIGLLRAVRDGTNDVKNQNSAAQQTATDSGQPPPATDPIPVNPTTDSTAKNATADTTAPAAQPAVDAAADPAATTVQTNNSVLAAITGNKDIKTTVDDGSDPYVSNGQSTVDAPTPVTQPTLTSPADLSAADIAAHGPAYDDNDNLMPGWTLDEDNNPRWVGGTFVEPATAKSAQESRDAANTAAKASPAAAKASTDTGNFKQADDWRVRLSLAPSANYLYKVAKSGDILFPLKATNGVIFPYIPQVTVNYKANYDQSDLTHSNYKIHMYKNSAVEDVQITADFTAQDTNEANYLLAVIHFFRSATKMFYGQDGKSGPRAGTPPPLVYLSGFGAYQFDNHPMVITNFNFTTPNEVDYIRAGVSSTWGGQDIVASGTKEYASNGSMFGTLATGLRDFRLAIGNLKKGAAPKEPQFKSLSNNEATYVPTKIQLQISASPVVSRNDISNNFSLTDYATGKLLRGSKRSGGGIW